jgi:hypothetical protein
VGTESDINSIFDALEEFTDLAQWHFFVCHAAEINSYYAQLKLVGKLDSNLVRLMCTFLTKRETSEGERR